MLAAIRPEQGSSVHGIIRHHVGLSVVPERLPCVPPCAPLTADRLILVCSRPPSHETSVRVYALSVNDQSTGAMAVMMC